jgi:hypothetical protein
MMPFYNETGRSFREKLEIAESKEVAASVPDRRPGRTGP